MSLFSSNLLSPQRRPLLAALALILGLGAAAWRAPHGPVPQLATPPAQTGPSAASALLTSTLLPQVAPAAHAAALAQLPDGEVLAAWFAGSKEGAPDVALYLSRYRNGAWTPPQAIATREQTQADTRRYVRKLGNPLLAVDGTGQLHLWYVSVAVGGWAGSSLNHRVSADGGEHWSPARRLITAPFLNISTLVRNPPLVLADGSFALPVYHEFISKHGEWLHLAHDGETVLDKARMPADRPLLQPAVVPLGNGQLLAVLRDAGPGPGRLRLATSADGGQHWSAAPPLEIANPNSAAAMTRLADGRLLLACNPQESNRNKLSLWLSADSGATWRESRVLEQSASGDDEFSYPALLQDRDGRIHVAYTWKRLGIKHVVLTPAVLNLASGGRP
ncbi:MAG: exo-alpha-sialidase [Betaproteobacteria bacterium]|nr:exo-alpha-sialidase [Betaproteobacteria bacterium]